MGLAIDTVQAFATAGAASPFPTAMAAAPGDSLTVRSYVPGTHAEIDAVLYNAGTTQKIRVESPLMHDNVTGLTWEPAEAPAAWLLPPEAGIAVSPVDTITVQGALGAAGTVTAGLVFYYENLRGVEGQYVRWGDIAGNIRYYKSVEIDLGAIAVGAWTDTLLTTTENQLHSDRDYAILGYDCATALDMVGVKGAFTGNLRACGPGASSTLDITDYFVYRSEKNKRPYIPVFNSNDRTAIFVSAANHAAVAGGAAHVYLMVAELRNRILK